jgi:hypothetical protein
MNLLIATLATLRLTRLITTDWWGEWLIVRPLKRWAGRYEQAEITHRIVAEEYKRDHDPNVKPENFRYMSRDGRTITAMEYVTQDYDEHDPWTWQAKLVSMTSCAHCFGFWAGVAVLASLAIVRPVPRLLSVWRFVMGALALSYLTGHVSAKLDG